MKTVLVCQVPEHGDFQFNLNKGFKILQEVEASYAADVLRNFQMSYEPANPRNTATYLSVSINTDEAEQSYNFRWIDESENIPDGYIVVLKTDKNKFSKDPDSVEDYKLLLQKVD